MQRLGLFLIGLGALALAGAVLSPLLGGSTETGGVAAVGMFLVILGLVFYFPSLLNDDTGATSTMRVAVLMVVSLFVVLTLKAGWGADTLEKLKLQDSWVWVLAAALGGKAFQSFAENATPPGSPTPAPGKAQPKPPAHARDEQAGIQDAP